MLGMGCVDWPTVKASQFGALPEVLDRSAARATDWGDDGGAPTGNDGGQLPLGDSQ